MSKMYKCVAALEAAVAPEVRSQPLSPGPTDTVLSDDVQVKSSNRRLMEDVGSQGASSTPPALPFLGSLHFP